MCMYYLVCVYVHIILKYTYMYYYMCICTCNTTCVYVHVLLTTTCVHVHVFLHNYLLYTLRSHYKHLCKLVLRIVIRRSSLLACKYIQVLVSFHIDM